MKTHTTLWYTAGKFLTFHVYEEKKSVARVCLLSVLSDIYSLWTFWVISQICNHSWWMIIRWNNCYNYRWGPFIWFCIGIFQQDDCIYGKVIFICYQVNNAQVSNNINTVFTRLTGLSIECIGTKSKLQSLSYSLVLLFSCKRSFSFIYAWYSSSFSGFAIWASVFCVGIIENICL